MSFERAHIIVYLCLLVLLEEPTEGTDPTGDEGNIASGSDRSKSDQYTDQGEVGETSSRSSDYLHEIANQYYRSRKFQNALQYYSELIEINPDEPKYYRNRAFCREKLNQPPDKAIADYEKSLVLEPQSSTVRFFLGGKLFELKKFEECIDHLEKALRYRQESEVTNDPDVRKVITRMFDFAYQRVEEAKTEEKKDDLTENQTDEQIGK